MVFVVRKVENIFKMRIVYDSVILVGGKISDSLLGYINLGRVYSFYS